MIDTARAVEVVALLSAIDRALHRLNDRGVDTTDLDVRISDLRDCLWHEVPDELALLMDREDGYDCGDRSADMSRSPTPERKTSLTFAEQITAAHLHFVQGLDQHQIAFCYGVNQGRVNEACSAIRKALQGDEATD